MFNISDIANLLVALGIGATAFYIMDKFDERKGIKNEEKIDTAIRNSANQSDVQLRKRIEDFIRRVSGKGK